MKNCIYALLFFIAISPLLLVADALNIAARHPRMRRAVSLIHSTSSVDAIHFKPGEAQTTISSLSASNFSPFYSEKLNGTELATNAMPLYLNTAQIHVPGFSQKKRIIFFPTTEGYFIAYDLDQRSVLWSLPLPDGFVVNSTPLMAANKNRIYFLASSDADENRGEPRIFATSLDGQHIDSKEISVEAPLSPILGCETFLSLYKNESIQFGCAAKTISIPLNKSGDFDPEKNIEFLTDRALDANPISNHTYLAAHNTLQEIVVEKSSATNAYTIHQHILTGERSKRETWFYLGMDQEIMDANYSNILQSQDHNNALFLLISNDIKPNSSHLKIFDAKIGQLLQDLPFPGHPSNTMPLAIDEEIYVASKGSGIFRFARSASYLEILQKSSYFHEFWQIFFAKQKHIW